MIVLTVRHWSIHWLTNSLCWGDYWPFDYRSNYYKNYCFLPQRRWYDVVFFLLLRGRICILSAYLRDFDCI